MFVVVYGGSGSGKSEYAESVSVMAEPGLKYYVATMQSFDEESKKKILRHREMRKTKNFDTIECQTNIQSISLTKNDTVLLECMSNLVANEMYSDTGAGTKTVENVIAGLKNLKETVKNVIVVTNNVFDDGIDYDEESMRYLEYLGRINEAMAKMADEVYEVVHGISIKIK